ncbi:MAG TPA: NAD-dependent epimerase/dehydratase family protein [Geminicoccaceae bacterium]|nr:NAD-dependent epimerase/dehydratase family protein [Geminicoccaceae bacterium]
MRPTVAVTGATGFIGRHVVRRLRADWRVRILARRPPDPALLGPEVEAVQGQLDDASLRRLLDGVDAVVHVAGLIKARTRDDFFRVNAEGIGRLAAVAAAAPRPPRLVLMSSLAAREPEISDYAASKLAGERALIAAGDALRWSILRPPAVYGPGDRATLFFFRCVRHGIGPLLGSADARLSLLHVADLADAVTALLADERAAGLIAEIDDGRGMQGGYRWPEMVEAAAAAFGRRARLLRIPITIPYGLAWLNRTLARAGYTPMLTPGKVRELYHPDWVCDAGPLMARTLWRPAVPLREGFAATVAWYRQHGWL